MVEDTDTKQAEDGHTEGRKADTHRSHGPTTKAPLLLLPLRKDQLQLLRDKNLADVAGVGRFTWRTLLLHATQWKRTQNAAVKHYYDFDAISGLAALALLRVS